MSLPSRARHSLGGHHRWQRRHHQPHPQQRRHSALLRQSFSAAEAADEAPLLLIDVPEPAGSGAGSRSEVSSESSLHNNIFDYLSGLSAAQEGSKNVASVEPDAVTRAVLRVTETYQSGLLLAHANTILIDAGQDKYEASYDIQASVDADGFIDVPVDFAPQLLDAEGGEIFDISDQQYTISESQQQHNHHQQQQLDRERQLCAWAADAAAAHCDLLDLRRLAFRLVCALLPQLELAPGFDCTTGQTDSLLLCLCAALSPRSAREFARESGVAMEGGRQQHLNPTVSLCSQPRGCVRRLRRRLLRFLRLLLPGLPMRPTLGRALALAGLTEIVDRVVRCNRRRRRRQRREKAS